MTLPNSELESPLLTKRVKGLLKEMNINTLEDLANLSYRVFENKYGIGKGSLENVISFLKIHHLRLREMPPEKEKKDGQ